MNFKCLAHKEKDKSGVYKEQSLTDHLYQVAIYAGKLGDIIGIKNIMKQVAYLHDLGKADRVFQDYINGLTNRKVNHSSAGARYWLHIIENYDMFNTVKHEKRFQFYKEIIIYLIQSHHGFYDLININSGSNKSAERLTYISSDLYNYEDILSYGSDLNKFLIENNELSLSELILVGYKEFNDIFDKLKRLAQSNPLGMTSKATYKKEFHYYISCFVRLCLSILKEADIYDAANAFQVDKQKIFEQDKLDVIWNDSYHKIEKIYKEYEKNSNRSELNFTRTEMAQQAKEFAGKYREGIFQFELPTGAGKTKSSLRYALTNAKLFHKKRIFYITAYLSVLEQNAEDIREIINDDSVILEHHSNVILDVKNYDETKQDTCDYSNESYLMESWESPIVLTTMVQFCNTLYKGQANQIRRFCKLIDSVIIIDEVQSLPKNVLYNFNLMMNFMKEIMHCNIVHCTATQPRLDSKILAYPVYYGNQGDYMSYIVDRELTKRLCFNRVDYYNLTGKDATYKMSTSELINHIKVSLAEVNSCLIVLNTKSAVKKLYKELSSSSDFSGYRVIYLTTNLCAQHRLDLIKKMKELLQSNRNGNANNKLICISTQLVEAGIDLDFDHVYRSIAGIDSIVQCAGRCNREGELIINGKLAKGKLFIIKYKEENLSNLPDIKETVDAAEEAIRSLSIENEDQPISLDDIKSFYYDKYYIENDKKLYYWDSREGTTMVDQLSDNSKRKVEFQQLHKKKFTSKLAQSFRTVADNFQLIKQNTVGVLVYYKNEHLISQLYKAIAENNVLEISKLLKMLQRTTVNVYYNEKLSPYIQPIKGFDGIYILGKEYYDKFIGVIVEGLADFII